MRAAENPWLQATEVSGELEVPEKPLNGE